MGYIYKITNKINGKVYIGLTTTSIEQRWRGHINESKKCDRHLYASMRKYGIENFNIEIFMNNCLLLLLEHFECSCNILLIRVIFW